MAELTTRLLSTPISSTSTGGGSSREDGRYDDISPATETVIATAPDASVGQVGEAIARRAARVRRRAVGHHERPRTAPAASTSSARRC